MTYAIAAAGTGGHVFPGLSVGEALVASGVTRAQILFVGGSRLESEVYPREGFPFLQVEIRGLQRSLTWKNLTLPAVVMKARRHIEEAISGRDIRVVLGMGGYVTIPAALAARRTRTSFMHSEQNAEAGLANRLVRRWAARSFTSFPGTVGLESAEWVGNPVRRPFWEFDRDALRPVAMQRYGLVEGIPVLGVFGGSLGAGAINEAVARMVESWTGSYLQVLHLTGARNFETMRALPSSDAIDWHRVGFEDSMEAFYAVCDLVVARAGGAVAELTATGTPAVLVPGQFGSTGHQTGNARYLTQAGAAVTLEESELGALAGLVERIVFSPGRLSEMQSASRRVARPRAALDIARAMTEAAR